MALLGAFSQQLSVSRLDPPRGSPLVERPPSAVESDCLRDTDSCWNAAFPFRRVCAAEDGALNVGYGAQALAVKEQNRHFSAVQ